MAQKTQSSNLILLLVVGGMCAGGGYYLWNSRKPSLMEEMQQPSLPEGEVEVVEEVIVIPEEGFSAQEVIEVSSPQQLEELMASDKKAVIKFYAHWCGACNHLASYFGDVAQTAGNDIVFYSINVDNQELMTKVNELKIPKEDIMYLPTIVFLQPGKTHEQITGAPSQEALTEKVRSVFGS